MNHDRRGFENPVAGVKKFKARLVREEQAATPTTTTPERHARQVKEKWCRIILTASE